MWELDCCPSADHLRTLLHRHSRRCLSFTEKTIDYYVSKCAEGASSSSRNIYFCANDKHIVISSIDEDYKFSFILMFSSWLVYPVPNNQMPSTWSETPVECGLGHRATLPPCWRENKFLYFIYTAIKEWKKNIARKARPKGEGKKKKLKSELSESRYSDYYNHHLRRCFFFSKKIPLQTLCRCLKFLFGLVRWSRTSGRRKDDFFIKRLNRVDSDRDRV